ncbi:MAG TPA: lytic transglycosylase domain-containing protein [Syntrophales bacterium]|nr:lytic transglycosylase domain-containing protein [Syntrophales bacterium]
MTISVKHDPAYFANCPLSGVSASVGAGSYRAGGMQGGAFASLLTDVLAAAGKSDGFQPDAPPISKEEIQQLITRLQERLNGHLFRMVADDQNGDDLPVSHILEIPASARSFPSEAPASKNTHIFQKNDVVSPAADLEGIIKDASKTFGVDDDLIRSIIKAESNYNIRSTSPKGAMGLMQLMPATARELGVKNPYDPEENIMSGTRYFKGLLDRYRGDRNLALAAYNWGMGNVEKNPEKMPRETSDYISRVSRYYREAKG